MCRQAQLVYMHHDLPVVVLHWYVTSQNSVGVDISTNSRLNAAYISLL